MYKKLQHKGAWWTLLAASSVALVASLVLSVEEVHLLKNPDAVLSCSISLALDCSVVMKTWQASVFFGVPNMFFGLMAFAVFVTVAVSALWGGMRYNKRFMLATNIGALAAFVFAQWLFLSSVYAIGTLCPWCLFVTTTSTLIFAATTFMTLRENYLGFSEKTNKHMQRFLDSGYYNLIFALIYVAMASAVILKFGASILG